MFDSTILLAHGRVVYSGALPKMLPFFAEHGHTCPAHYNPADFVMFLMQQESEETVAAITEGFAKAEAARQSADGEAVLAAGATLGDLKAVAAADAAKMADFGVQMYELARREPACSTEQTHPGDVQLWVCGRARKCQHKLAAKLDSSGLNF